MERLIMAEKADYRPMWEGLGIDLEGHDGLLGVLNTAYTDMYLSQGGRPGGMGYFDFVVSECHGLRIKELLDAKGEGRKVIGTFCVYVPEEIILALDAVCVGLCSGAEIGMEKAEEYLPRNLCSLIKSFMGFELASVCPYFRACDILVGETTCDGKKKAYEILQDVKETYVMELPQKKGAEDRRMWADEVRNFISRAEEVTGRKLTGENLKKAIRLVNDRRRAQLRLRSLRKADPAPMSGRDALLVNQIAFYDNPERFIESTNKLCDELEVRVEQGIGAVEKGAPRVVISGCPMALPNWKLPWILENSGAVVVAEESCVGERWFRTLVDESGETLEDMIDNIVDRYLTIDCACFTPNPDRPIHVVETTEEFAGDGVVHYSISFCTPYMVEAKLVEDALAGEGIPLLKIETDYSQGDVGQLRTRIDAFLEIITERKSVGAK